MSLSRIISTTSRQIACKKPFSQQTLASQTLNARNLERCYFSSLTPCQAKGSGFFGWNPFRKKDIPVSDEPELPAPQAVKEDEDATTDLMSSDEDLSVSGSPAYRRKKYQRHGFPLRDNNGTLVEAVEIPDSQLETIITKKVVAFHPEASASDSLEKLESLSLKDAKIKLQILSEIMNECHEISNTYKFDYPNRNLNNTDSVKDMFDYYLRKKDRFDIREGYNVHKYFKQLEEASTEETPLPSNLQYVPYERSIRFAPRPVALPKKHRQNRRGMRQHLIPRYGPNNN